MAKKRKIIRAEKAGWTGGVDKRNRAGRATWNRESEGGEGMLSLPLLSTREAV